jgi:hypothetical protein
MPLHKGQKRPNNTSQIPQRIYRHLTAWGRLTA